MLWPGLAFQFFSRPAGNMAGYFLDASVVPTPEAILLHHPAIDVAVTEACSGFDFFTLIVALWAGWNFYRSGWSRKSLRFALIIPFTAYGITFLGNVSRIVCAVQIRVVSLEIVPPSYQASIHQSIGVAVFLTVLIIFWLTLTKFYERKSRI